MALDRAEHEIDFSLQLQSRKMSDGKRGIAWIFLIKKKEAVLTPGLSK